MSRSRRRARIEPVVGESACLEAAIDRLRCETQLWQSFLGAHRRILDLLADQLQADHHFSLEWFDVMIQLAAVPGMRLRQRELRDRLLLSESGVSRMLGRMAEAGLLERTPAADDRRGMAVALTDKGVATLVAAIGPHLDLVAQLFTDRLTVAEGVALQHILDKLAAGAGSAPRDV